MQLVSRGHAVLFAISALGLAVGLTPHASAAPAPRRAPVPRLGLAARSPVPPMASATASPAPPPAPPPPAPQSYRNRVVSADGALNTGVGVYSDCSGWTPLTRVEAAIDTCVRGRTYFVGHNPGVFTPLYGEGVGSIIVWWDGRGVPHRLRVADRRFWPRADNGGLAPMAFGGEVAEFQTCDGSSEELILDTVAA